MFRTISRYLSNGRDSHRVIRVLAYRGPPPISLRRYHDITINSSTRKIYDLSGEIIAALQLTERQYSREPRHWEKGA